MKQKNYIRSDIQGLRAFAVLIVVIFHAKIPFFEAGYIGVDIFFAISGYVITGMILREIEDHRKFSFINFYWNRFKRLTPALALVVLVTVVSSIFLQPVFQSLVTAKTGAGSLLMLSNFVIANTSGGYFDPQASQNALLNTWSLAVEEQFYLLFPTVLVFAILFSRSNIEVIKKIQISLLVIITLISLAFFISNTPELLSMNGAYAELVHRLQTKTIVVLESLNIQLPIQYKWDWIFGYYGPVVRIWEFGFGAIAAIAWAIRGTISLFTSKLLSFTGIFLIFVSMCVLRQHENDFSILFLAPVVGTTLILYSGNSQKGFVYKLFSHKSMVYVGDRSYGFYLWHWPILVLLWSITQNSYFSAIILLPLTFLAGYVSYRYIEQPLRKYSYSSVKIKIISVFGIWVMPLFLTFIVIFGATNYWGNESVKESVTPHNAAGCEGSNETFTSCTVNIETSGNPIFLWGDSNATQYADAFKALSAQEQFPLTISSYPGCAPLDIYQNNNSTCSLFYKDNIEKFSTTEPSIVVLAMTSRTWAPPKWISGELPIDAKQQLYVQLENGLTKTILNLKSLGHTPLIVLPIARFEYESMPLSFDSVPWISVMTNNFVNNRNSLSDLEQEQITVRDIFTKVSKETNTASIDPTTFQCPGKVCRPFVNGHAIYSDISHLSANFSLDLVPLFSRGISTLNVQR